MKIKYEQVLNHVLSLLNNLSGDWEYSGIITPETGLLSDVGLESLELVIIGIAIQEHYKQAIPFPEFFADLGERQVSDVFVGDLVQFIHQYLERVSVAGVH